VIAPFAYLLHIATSKRIQVQASVRCLLTVPDADAGQIDVTDPSIDTKGIFIISHISVIRHRYFRLSDMLTAHDGKPSLHN
jgi:hypothetical protein